MIAGRLNKQIAADLGTAEKTIKVHRARGMEKMRVRSVAELVRIMERTRPQAPAAGPDARAGSRPAEPARAGPLIRSHWTKVSLVPAPQEG